MNPHSYYTESWSRDSRGLEARPEWQKLLCGEDQLKGPVPEYRELSGEAAREKGNLLGLHQGQKGQEQAFRGQPLYFYKLRADRIQSSLESN